MCKDTVWNSVFEVWLKKITAMLCGDRTRSDLFGELMGFYIMSVIKLQMRLYHTMPLERKTYFPGDVKHRL